MSPEEKKPFEDLHKKEQARSVAQKAMTTEFFVGSFRCCALALLCWPVVIHEWFFVRACCTFGVGSAGSVPYLVAVAKDTLLRPSGTCVRVTSAVIFIVNCFRSCVPLSQLR